MIAFAFLSASNYFFFPFDRIRDSDYLRGAFCVCVTVERRRVLFGPVLAALSWAVLALKDQGCGGHDDVLWPHRLAAP